MVDRHRGLLCPRGLALAALMLLSFSSAGSGEITDCGDGEIRDKNPIGTCICDQHLWVAPGCREGYFCIDTTGKGCYKVRNIFFPLYRIHIFPYFKNRGLVTYSSAGWYDQGHLKLPSWIFARAVSFRDLSLIRTVRFTGRILFFKSIFFFIGLSVVSSLNLRLCPPLTFL